VKDAVERLAILVYQKQDALTARVRASWCRKNGKRIRRKAVTRIVPTRRREAKLFSTIFLALLVRRV
jgi:hypothetical protein